MNRFYIDETLVDTDRCRLLRDGGCISLEPKVMLVLQFLAMHPGEVVSHQTLLEAIWTNTVVEPSALQRCIAQLRKAFHDDARQQRVIATYPKRGYSLVAPVRPESPRTVPAATAPSRDNPDPPARRDRRPVLAAGLAAVFLVLGFTLTSPLRDAGLNAAASGTPAAMPAVSLLENPALLAAIAEPDDFPVYSPDGRFVVYPRYLEERKAHLWARDLAYGSDFMMTEEAGLYEYLSWSRDGSQLLFVDATCLLQADCQSRHCSSLKTVSISQSETNILGVQKLIDCSTSRLISPEWLGSRELAVIELDDDKATLVRFDLKTLSREVLYESSDMIPYHLSYSRQTSTLTIMAINPYGRKELLFLDTRTGAINRNDTAVFSSEEDWYPSSNPL